MKSQKPPQKGIGPGPGGPHGAGPQAPPGPGPGPGGAPGPMLMWIFQKPQRPKPRLQASEK